MSLHTHNVMHILTAVATNPRSALRETTTQWPTNQAICVWGFGHAGRVFTLSRGTYISCWLSLRLLIYYNNSMEEFNEHEIRHKLPNNISLMWVRGLGLVYLSATVTCRCIEIKRTSLPCEEAFLWPLICCTHCNCFTNFSWANRLICRYIFQSTMLIWQTIV